MNTKILEELRKEFAEARNEIKKYAQNFVEKYI